MDNLKRDVDTALLAEYPDTILKGEIDKLILEIAGLVAKVPESQRTPFGQRLSEAKEEQKTLADQKRDLLGLRRDLEN